MLHIILIWFRHNKKYIVFGKHVEGHDVLKKIENCREDHDVIVKIINGGESEDDNQNVGMSKCK